MMPKVSAWIARLRMVLKAQAWRIWIWHGWYRQDRMFFLIKRRCWLEFSTLSTVAAPRLRHSKPRDPVPLNKSKTRAFGMRGDNRLKIASRTRSEVGRMPSPLGAARIFPESLPPIIRMGFCWLPGRVADLRGSAKQARIYKRLSFSLNEHPEIVKRHGDDKNVAVDHVHDGAMGKVSHVRRGKHDMRSVDDNLSFLPGFSGNVDVA